jgi:hypothetical protein
MTGFIRNLSGTLHRRAVVSNAVHAMRLAGVPLTYATSANGRRIYFLAGRAFTMADRLAIITNLKKEFSIVIGLKGFRYAVERYAEPASQEFTEEWKSRNARRHKAKPAKEPAKVEPAKPNREKFVRSLRWDQHNRIQDLLASTAGATPEHSLTFARWLVCAAWRTLEPSARAFAIAFRGASEAQSVAALDALAGPWLGHGLSPEAQPGSLRNQVTDRLMVHAQASDRRNVEIFAVLAARVEDFIGDEAEPIKRTFALACTLNDDEPLPEGFLEVRVTKGFDVEALRRDRDQLFAEARECAMAAMSNINPNEIVRRKRLAYQESLHA